MKTRKIIAPVLLVVLAAAALIGFGLRSVRTTQSAPIVSVSACVADEDDQTVTLNWSVTNDSKQTIHFDADRLAALTVDGVEKVSHTDAVILAPEETITLSVPVYGLDRSSAHSVCLTAECNEGISASFRFTIPTAEVTG